MPRQHRSRRRLRCPNPGNCTCTLTRRDILSLGAAGAAALTAGLMRGEARGAAEETLADVAEEGTGIGGADDLPSLFWTGLLRRVPGLGVPGGQ